MNHQLARNDQELFAAIDGALAQLAPLFPLSQFVAVNPFLGFTHASFESSAERLVNLRGRAPLLEAQEYKQLYESGAISAQDLEWAGAPEHSAEQLLRALDAPTEQRRQLVQTALDVLDSELPGTGIRQLFSDEISKWCATCFDQNQTSWRSPWAERGLYSAFRQGAVHDATLELQGLLGFRDFVATLPNDASAALTVLFRELSPAAEDFNDFVHRELSLVSGWSSFCRYIVREEELRGREHTALHELLAVRLAYDVALLHAYPCLRPWVGTSRRCFVREVPLSVLCRWQLAYEVGFQREIASKLSAQTRATPSSCARPDVQAVFCIDVRSEPFRRHLEASASGVNTLGFAGFFGFAVGHLRADGSGVEARCPALLVPACESADAGETVNDRRRLRRERASTWKAIQNAAASCFTFVETLGVASAAGLLSLEQGDKPAWRDRPRPELLNDVDVGTVVDRAAGMLRNMSLTHDFARVLLLCGHGSHSANNPYASALDCGACGGHAGDVNARLAAQALNDPNIRARLAERGIEIPGDTWVVAGLHDTMTDEVELFDLDLVPASHRNDITALQQKLAAASEAARRERAPSLGLERGRALLPALRRRAADVAETRPEWGLTGNAAIIVGRRSMTRGIALQARCFLHEYRHEEDADGSVLSLILSAPVVVASWINLQYYASRVDPENYGSGNKVLHNVVGGIGVFEGNGGDLRMGLPLQSIHDGQRFVHEPRRLSVFIEAPREKLRVALEALPAVKQLFDGGWIHLLAIENGRIHAYSRAEFRELGEGLSEGLAA